MLRNVIVTLELPINNIKTPLKMDCMANNLIKTDTIAIPVYFREE